ncbi:MAG: stage III sporulation AC/AD family protein, partial [Oscillospiraceae bacterium]|nr:stage III sporulation AC/AD family protein [Oscillospiraceae bacterium]
MDTALKIIAICLTGAVLSMVLRKNSPEFAFCVAVGCCVMAVAAATELISPVLSFLRHLQQMTGLNEALLAPLLKTVAIGFLTQIAGGFCADAGEQ